jgi:hypothetical protein
MLLQFNVFSDLNPKQAGRHPAPFPFHHLRAETDYISGTAICAPVTK